MGTRNQKDKGINLKEEYANLCAYYPYSATVTDAARVTLTPHILADDETPLAYATNHAANAANKSVLFSMRQAYCGWKSTSSGQYQRGSHIERKFSLIAAGLNKESVLNIGTGVASDIAADAGILTFSGDMALAKNSTVTRNIVLPPAAAAPGGLKVGVKVKEYGNRVLNTTLNGLTRWRATPKYAVTITVNGTTLGVSSVEVLPWTQTTVNNGGNPIVPTPEGGSPTPPEPEIGIQVPSADINLGGTACTDQDKIDLAKLIWAPGNLRQTNNDGSGPVIMAAATTDYGHYYTHG